MAGITAAMVRVGIMASAENVVSVENEASAENGANGAGAASARPG
jgi:hypothetical protein